MDMNTLAAQDASTSRAIIDALSSDPAFAALSASEGAAILARDAEDAEKLQAGVELSIAAGQLKPQASPPSYKAIDVMGKTPDQVCDVILQDMGEAATTGGIVVLCGLSGTGKGTTVRTLGKRLPAGKSTAWSNGNVFRSLTLLAATWCEQQDDLVAFDADRALTKANLDAFMGMLEFGKFGGADSQWDIKIEGLGIRAFVSEIMNTDLKSVKVKTAIPTVARVTQGCVISFAAGAAQRMAADGLIVLLEGREATVNYIPSPYRFTLTMSDNAALGQRRAAQRIGAEALNALESRSSAGAAAADKGTAMQAVRAALKKLAAEAGVAADGVNGSNGGVTSRQIVFAMAALTAAYSVFFGK